MAETGFWLDYVYPREKHSVAIVAERYEVDECGDVHFHDGDGLECGFARGTFLASISPCDIVPASPSDDCESEKTDS